MRGERDQAPEWEVAGGHPRRRRVQHTRHFDMKVQAERWNAPSWRSSIAANG